MTHTPPSDRTAHHNMMLFFCIPVLVLIAGLIFTGIASPSTAVLGLICIAVMGGLMYFLMRAENR